MNLSSSATAAPGWRGRPVRRGHMFAVFGGVIVLWLALLLIAALWLHGHYAAVIDVRDQPVSLRLPGGLPARARVETDVRARLDWEPEVTTHIDQDLDVALPPRLQARARTRFDIPVDLTVNVAAEIPVTLVVDTDVEARPWLPVFHVHMPVSLRVPVSMSVPVRGMLPLALDAAVQADTAGAIKVPLRTSVRVKVPLHTDVRARAVSETAFELLAPENDVGMVVERADMKLPLCELRLDRQSAPPGP